MLWTQIIVGVLVLVSPWVLEMGGTVIAWTNGALGVFLILAGIWKLMIHKGESNNISE